MGSGSTEGLSSWEEQKVTSNLLRMGKWEPVEAQQCVQSHSPLVTRAGPEEEEEWSEHQPPLISFTYQPCGLLLL